MPLFVWHIGGKRKGAIVGEHHYATSWPLTGVLVDEETGTPCPPVSVSAFRQRFPEFAVADYPDSMVRATLDEASCRADYSWSSTCMDCQTAILFLTAHYLAIQASAAAILPSGGGEEGGSTGIVTGVMFEGMRVSYGGGSIFGGSSSSAPFSDIASTPYGKRYLELLKLNKPAVLVV